MKKNDLRSDFVKIQNRTPYGVTAKVFITKNGDGTSISFELCKVKIFGMVRLYVRLAKSEFVATSPDGHVGYLKVSYPDEVNFEDRKPSTILYGQAYDWMMSVLEREFDGSGDLEIMW
jgi:hypothetical protein